MVIYNTEEKELRIPEGLGNLNLTINEGNNADLSEYAKTEYVDEEILKVNAEIENINEDIDVLEGRVIDLENNGGSGGGGGSNVVYIYAQWDNNLSEEQWLEIVENYPNKIYKIVLNAQSFEENGKEYKAETVVEVVGVNYEQNPELSDNNGTIYYDCTVGFISGVHNNTNYIWSREFGEYGYEMYVREEGIPSRQEVDDLSNTLYETANAIVPKIYYIDKNNLSLEDFNNIKNEVNNSKVILNLGDGENVEIIKTTDNALYAINCYWVNENDTITYNELSDNGGGSGSVNVYNEVNNLGNNIETDTEFISMESNLTTDEFDEIMTKLSNNERVIIKNMYANIEITGFLNRPYFEVSFMGFSVSLKKDTYFGNNNKLSNLLIKWVKEKVDGETKVYLNIFNLSYMSEMYRYFDGKIDNNKAQLEDLKARITALENQ